MDYPCTGLAEVLERQGRRLDWVAAHLTPPVSMSTVSRWRSGERAIPSLRVAQLAELLGVERDEITAPSRAVAS